MSTDKNTNKSNPALKALEVLIIVIILFVLKLFLPIQNPNQPPQDTTTSTTQTFETIVPEGSLTLTMIECGQADSFLFIQDDTVALIDCGTRSTGDDVVKYLKDLGIKKIDFLVGTHPHDDHMGGMYDVITNFEIGKLIMPKVKEGDVSSIWYTKLEAEIVTQKIKVHYPKVNDTFKIGDANMVVIGPPDNFDPDGELNNYSIVLKVTFGEIDIIMTGDAEKEVEKLILDAGIDIEAEILKVGHHGSYTSTSDEFLDAISPTYALISCKVGNKHDHPTKVTMDKLEKQNIEVYRTDESGTVVVTIFENEITFSSDPDDYKSGPELAGGK